MPSRLRKLMLLGSLACGAAACTVSEQVSPVPLPAPDVPIDVAAISDLGDTVFESEPSVAVAPDGTVAVGWLAATSWQDQPEGIDLYIGYTFSRDGGATWSPAGRFAAPEGGYLADIWLAADSQSNFYATFLGVDDRTDPISLPDHIYLARSSAGETSFGDAVEVSDPADPFFFDQPKVVIAEGDRPLVVYSTLPIGSLTGGVVVASSDDGGASFTPETVVVPPQLVDAGLANLCVSSDGSRVGLVSYLIQNSATQGLELRTSSDGGRTWSGATSIRNDSLTFTVPECVIAGDEVWVTYGVTPGSVDPPIDELRVAHSSDRGASIDRDDEAGDRDAGSLFLAPKLVRHDDASLDLLYYTGKEDLDEEGSLRIAKAPGGARSFDPSEALHAPITFTASRASRQWLGDYVGAVSSKGRVYAVYADNTSGASHVSFHRTTLR